MEKGNTAPIELTGQGQNAYSNSRVIFMPDGSQSPDIKEQLMTPPEPQGPAAAENGLRTVSSEEARAAWESQRDMSDLPPGQARFGQEIIEDLIKRGIPPQVRRTHNPFITARIAEPPPVDGGDGAPPAEPPIPPDGGGGDPPGGDPPNELPRGLEEVIRQLLERSPRGQERMTPFEYFEKEVLNVHLSKPDVVRMLSGVDGPPNFYQKGVPRDQWSKDIENFVKMMESDLLPGAQLLEGFTKKMTAKEIKVPGGEQGEITIEPSDAVRKILFEWAIEKVISIPDITPDSPYRLDMYADMEKTNVLIAGSRNFRGDHDFIRKIGTLIEVRQNYHELRQVLSQPETYKKFLQSLKTNGLLFVNNDLAGVRQALLFHERLNSSKLSKVKKWFSPKDLADIDLQVEQRMRALWESGHLKQDGRVLTEWELERAIRIANTHFNGTQRQAVYEGAGEIPAPGTDRIASTKNEYISRSMYPFKQLAIRFNAGQDHGDANGSTVLLRHIFRRKREQEQHNYDHDHGGKQSITKPIFGLKTETVLANQLGAPDLRSHKGWRNPIINFSGIRLVQGEPGDPGNPAGSMSLLEYFISKGAIMDDTTFEPSFSMKVDGDVETVVLGQTLYLSALADHGDFTAALKEKIWQKRAILNPAAVVNFRPEIISAEEQAAWAAIEPHLDIAFSIWADNEFQTKYKITNERRGFTMDELAAEKKRFSDGGDEYKYQILQQEYLVQTLSPSQRDFLRTVIDRAHGEAGYLSEAIMPHSYMLDDTPYVSWHTDEQKSIRGLDDPNMFRLFNDQNTLQEKAYGGLTGLIEHPSHVTNLEWLTASVEGLTAVWGRHRGQYLMEGFLLGAMDFARVYPEAKWLGAAMERLNKPRSDLEKYTGVKEAFDVDALRAMLEYAVAHGAVANHLNHGAKQSRYQQLLKEEHLGDLAQNKKKFRNIFQLLLVLLPVGMLEAIFKESQEGMNGAG